MDSVEGVNRLAALEALRKEDWDLIIIGGGITGAGILLDTTTRGLKSLLIEKNDFAWGTSSRSTKLIHGGLRYLKQMEINLVREVGLERAIVYQNARHLVRPEKMLLPISKNGSMGRLSVSAGLWVYDCLARVKSKEKRSMLAKKETLQTEPMLHSKDLIGGGLYYEYRTDDARLTIEIIKKAVELGGKAINHLEVCQFIKKRKGIQGVVVRDAQQGWEEHLKASVVVNAAGPWVDKVRLLDQHKLPKRHLLLTKGVHLVVPREKLPLSQSVYFDVPTDNRMIFCIPRGRIIYMGTTDTVFQGNIDKPVAQKSDAQYILNAVNAMFPESTLSLEDVESSWAGLRPLIHQEGKKPSDISRKDEIFESPDGLISIAGGKLTGYRKMAERISKKVMQRLQLKWEAEGTKRLQVSGANFDSEEALKKQLNELTVEFSTDFTPENMEELFFRYGSNTREILVRARSYHHNNDTEKALLKGELDYTVSEEFVRSLSDFFHRRTGMIYFDIGRVHRQKKVALDHLSCLLNWDDQAKALQLEELECLLSEVVSFKQ